MDLPEGYSFMEIDGQLIRNETDALLVVRESDQTQHWIYLEDTESQTASVSQSRIYPDYNEYVDETQDKEAGSLSDSQEDESEDLISSGIICDSSKGDKRKEWTDSETLLLIDTVYKYKSKLNDPKMKKKTLFESISNDINITSNGEYVITMAQAENKWKSLAKKYKDIKDHNNRTGNEAKTWKYFQLMSEIIGDRPNVEPKASCSSLQLANNTGNSSLRDQLQEKLKEKQKKSHDSPEGGVKKKTPKKSGSRSELLTFLKTHESKTEQREKEKMEMLKNQHEDLKSFMQKILTKLDDKQDDKKS